MGHQAAILRLAACLAGLVALTAISGTLRRGQEASVEVTQIHRAKSGMFSMEQNIELDFRNLGSGVGPEYVFPPEPIDTLACERDTDAYCHFRFYARVDSTSRKPSVVEYRWEKRDTAIVDPDATSVPLYEVTRFVDEEFRTAMDRVSRFRLAFHDHNGDRTTSLNAARSIDVELQALVPTTSRNNRYNEVTWRQTFAPGNLARE